MKTYQMAMLPGIAMTWYLVQLLVVRAALPRTVARTAAYRAVPHNHLLPVVPSLRMMSPYQMSSEPTYRTSEW
jgi:hypothetical protein